MLCNKLLTIRGIYLKIYNNKNSCERNLAFVVVVVVVIVVLDLPHINNNIPHKVVKAQTYSTR